VQNVAERRSVRGLVRREAGVRDAFIKEKTLEKFCHAEEEPL